MTSFLECKRACKSRKDTMTTNPSARVTFASTAAVDVAASLQTTADLFKDRTDGFGLASVGVAKNQNLEPTVGLRLAVGHPYAQPATGPWPWSN
jgi:hypothetical protein